MLLHHPFDFRRSYPLTPSWLWHHAGLLILRDILRFLPPCVAAGLALHLLSPPRPLASRPVDALNQVPNPRNLQNLTIPQGGGFTLPLPPSYRSGSLTCSPGWRTQAPLDTSKCVVKISIFCLWAHLCPIKVVMYTTLTRKSIMLTTLLGKSCDLDDFSVKR